MGWCCCGGWFCTGAKEVSSTAPWKAATGTSGRTGYVYISQYLLGCAKLIATPGNRREPPQTHLRRRPATHRSAYLPRPPVAPQSSCLQIHRPVPPSHLFSLPDYLISRHYLLPRRSLRRWPRMVYAHNYLAREAVSQIWR